MSDGEPYMRPETGMDEPRESLPAVVVRLQARIRDLEAAQAAAERDRARLAATASALRESEERYALAMKGPNEGLWDWNPLTKELYLSARLLEILGLGSRTIRTTSRHWLDLVHPDDRDPYQARLVAHLKGDLPHFEAEYRVRDQHGAYRWVLARGLAQRDAEGRAFRMVGSIGDITERKQAEQALYEANERLEERVAERTRQLQDEVESRRRAEAEARAAKEQAELACRAKSDFVANMSHELRTPLNAIIGFSDMMRSAILGPVQPDRYGEYVNVIWESGTHLLAIINDILDMAKIEAGKFDLHREPAEVAGTVHSALRLVGERAAAAALHLEAAVPADLGSGVFDPLRVRQVLVNLLSNAIKFTAPGGRVILSARREGETLVLAVSDTGIGMTPDQAEAALQPFVQIDSGLGRRYAGTGLGLPLARSFVEMHGGTLGVASELGRGTTVTVRLPLAP